MHSILNLDKKMPQVTLRHKFPCKKEVTITLLNQKITIDLIPHILYNLYIDLLITNNSTGGNFR